MQGVHRLPRQWVSPGLYTDQRKKYLLLWPEWWKIFSKWEFDCINVAKRNAKCKTLFTRVHVYQSALGAKIARLRGILVRLYNWTYPKRQVLVAKTRPMKKTSLTKEKCDFGMEIAYVKARHDVTEWRFE
ncbi:hypothetical protein [Rhodobacter ferrooxidans]|uniref:hypothetical protein n=1 Tax=Rhodobacter ferrooxidans TaxID=371731 RepID=UPI0018DB348C|nr:hypothetical protein [Rhodobacter sp. SW2]